MQLNSVITAINMDTLKEHVKTNPSAPFAAKTLTANVTNPQNAFIVKEIINQIIKAV